VLSPASLLYVVPFAIVLTIILKDINTAFGTAALLIPTIFWLQHLQWDRALLGTALAAIIVYKHIPDYRAYRQGRRQFLGGVKK
ncbi:MAG TPA: hypothetical protein VLH18_06855, partial [Candidatus Limnocylindrales bacterium]|nr:hypothetical protein [Candidatus Limnocylindrales bacterium]